jgi:HEPN domain-containing protein
MLRPDRPVPGSPADWLRLARADLALARVPLPPGGLLETLCFHAQQCVEKCIKAVLVRHGVAVEKTHSIARLVDLLPSNVERAPAVVEAARLTPYATTWRYPVADDADGVTVDDYTEAVRLAEGIVVWATTILGELQEAKTAGGTEDQPGGGEDDSDMH